MNAKEIVVRRPGADWSFHLPERHKLKFGDDRRTVSLTTPDASSLYSVDRVDDSDPEETVVLLGKQQGKGGPSGARSLEALGYPLPEIQDEFARLKARWVAAGLRETDFNAWPQGDAPAEVQLRRIRRILRSSNA